jgi:nucleotide-binding universal stress UspA family protein
MPIKSILVPLNGMEAAKPALEAAFTVALQLGAHVDVLHVRPDPRDAVPILGEGVSGALIEEIMDVAEKEAKDRGARARAMFEQCRAARDIPVVAEPVTGKATVSWREETGREDEITTMRGRLSDLVAVSRPTEDTDIATTMTLNAALFDTGRPVLVAPPQFGGGSLGTRVAISWNGSAEAARAISAAMPLILRAKQVVVLTAVGETPSAPAVPEMLTYLSWHGVKAETHALSSVNKIVGDVLLKECAALGVDLLVMGAYTRNRLRQMILGGVTRHVLEHATIPLFMAH